MSRTLAAQRALKWLTVNGPSHFTYKRDHQWICASFGNVSVSHCLSRTLVDPQSIQQAAEELLKNLSEEIELEEQQA